MPTNQPTSLDPQAVAMAKAIRQTESGGNFAAQGKSGEYGAYQFMPDTWAAYSKEAGVNTPLDAATPDQQNQVAYAKIKQWKDEGYNVGQIASMWNAGPGKPDAYKQNYTGTNSKGVQYDTPAYAQKVATAYQTFKGQSGTVNGAPDGSNPSYIDDVSKTLGDAGTGVAQGATKALTGLATLNPVQAFNGTLQGVGAAAGGLSGLINDSIEHAPVVGGLYKGLEGLIGQGAQAVAGTGVGQSAIKGYQSFAAAHPETAADLGAAGNIITAIPMLKGLGVAKDAVSSGISTALKGGVDAAVETVAPKLTAGEAADALAKRGTVTKGLLRETQIAPDPRVADIAQTVKDNVPKFNPAKPLITNIKNVQTVVSKMASDLKTAVQESGADRIYSYKELASKLNAIEKPVMVTSDKTLQNVYNNVIKKALDIAKSKGGKVSNLLDVRQDFDAYIGKQFPNLYTSDTLTPIRSAVKDIRNGITDFTADNLPDGFGLKSNLLTQHKLITAIENMSEKATKGATKEIGTNVISRFGGRHPVLKGLVKTGAKAAVEGSGIGAAMHLLN